MSNTLKAFLAEVLLALVAPCVVGGAIVVIARLKLPSPLTLVAVLGGWGGTAWVAAYLVRKLNGWAPRTERAITYSTSAAVVGVTIYGTMFIMLNTLGS